MFCNKCGLCCKLFDKVDLPPEYQELNDGTGKCKYLKDNLCTIYSERPFLCNSTLIYEKYYKDKITFTEFEEIIKNECDEIKKKYKGDLLE